MNKIEDLKNLKFNNILHVVFREGKSCKPQQWCTISLQQQQQQQLPLQLQQQQQQLPLQQQQQQHQQHQPLEIGQPPDQ